MKAKFQRNNFFFVETLPVTVEYPYTKKAMIISYYVSTYHI